MTYDGGEGDLVRASCKRQVSGSVPLTGYQLNMGFAASGSCRCRCRGGSLFPPGYSGDHPCPTKGAAVQSHNDEDQSTLQGGIRGVRQERYGEAELH